MYRDKILLRSRIAAKRITLSNERSFVAKYERISWKNLPSNVTIKNTWTIGPRQQGKRKTQTESEMLGKVFRLGKNLLMLGAITKGISLGSRAINSELGRKIIDEGIKHAPGLYRYGKERVTDKTLKKALESDVANHVAEKVEENLFS